MITNLKYQYLFLNLQSLFLFLADLFLLHQILSNWHEEIRVHRQLLVNRARMSGLLIFDYKDRYDEAVKQLSKWINEGKIQVREHILDGMDYAPGAIQMLYKGENQGKLLIKVD